MIEESLILLGIESLDYEYIQTKMDEGQLPNISALISSGATGRFMISDPVTAHSTFGSLLTGHESYHHQSFLSREFDQKLGRYVPATRSTLSKPSLWEILDYHKIRSNVVGWLNTHPADSFTFVNVVSDHLNLNRLIKFSDNEISWDIKGRVANHSEEAIAHCKWHPAEVSDHLLSEAFGTEVIHRQRLANILRRILAKTLTTYTAFTYLRSNNPAKVQALYLNTIEKIYVTLTNKELQVDQDMSDLILAKTYQLVDYLIGLVLSDAQPDTSCLLMTDAGHTIQKTRANKVRWHRYTSKNQSKRTFFILKHNGIKADSLFMDGNIYMILPTILHILDLPKGANLQEALIASHRKEQSILDYSEYTSNQVAPIAFDINQLDKSNKKERPIFINRLFCQALSYCSAERYDDAKVILEKLKIETSNINISELLDYCNLQLGLPLEEISKPADSKTKISNFQKSLSKLAKAKMLIKQNKGKSAINVLIEAETACKNEANILLQIGRLFEKLQDYQGAERCYDKSEVLSQGEILPINSKGLLFSKMGLTDRAISKFDQSLELDPYQKVILYHKAKAHLKKHEIHNAMGALKLSLHIDQNFQEARLLLLKHLAHEAVDYKKHLDIFNNNLKGESVIISFDDPTLIRWIGENYEQGTTESPLIKVIKQHAKSMKSKVSERLSKKNVVFIPFHLLLTLPPHRKYNLFMVESEKNTISTRIKKYRDPSQPKSKKISAEKMAGNFSERSVTTKEGLRSLPHFEVSVIKEDLKLSENLNEIISKHES